MRLYTITLMAVVLAMPLAAQRPATAASAGAADRDTTKPTPVPAEQSSVTDHTIRVAGQVVAYRATAATMLLKNDKDESIGGLDCTSYTRTDAKGLKQRPRGFIYNGGRGSASGWVDMGGVGPG